MSRPNRVRGASLSRLARLVLVCAVLASSGVAACASSSGSGRSGAGGNRNFISSEDLRALPPMNALQAVERLRGQWTRIRNAGTPSVHVDGRFTGGLEVLSAYNLEEVEEIRYRPARDATTLYGTNYPAGVIEITTRRGKR